MLTFINPSNFRHIILLATLSEKTVLIEGIREDEPVYGLQEYETLFLKLVEKITNGSNI